MDTDNKPVISMGAARVYERIRALHNDVSGCHISFAEIGAFSTDNGTNYFERSISNQQVRRYVRELVAARLLILVGASRNGSNLYILPSRRYDFDKLPINHQTARTDRQTFELLKQQYHETAIDQSSTGQE